MIIRVFKLTEASAKYLGNLPREDAVLVVKSEHKVRQMFIDVLEQAVYERADTKPAFDAIGAYFNTDGRVISGNGVDTPGMDGNGDPMPFTVKPVQYKI